MKRYRDGEVASIDRIENGWLVSYFTYKREQRFFEEWDDLMGWLKEWAIWEDTTTL